MATDGWVQRGWPYAIQVPSPPSAPEDAGWIGFDSGEQGLDGPIWKNLVVVMPAPVAVGAVEGPCSRRVVVSELGNLGGAPFWTEVRVPRRATLNDRYRLAAMRALDSDFASPASVSVKRPAPDTRCTPLVPRHAWLFVAEESRPQACKRTPCKDEAPRAGFRTCGLLLRREPRGRYARSRRTRVGTLPALQCGFGVSVRVARVRGCSI